MTLFFLGQRVEYQHTTDPRIYRGTLVRYYAKGFYADVEENGKRFLVRSDRLRHIGGCARLGGKAA